MFHWKTQITTAAQGSPIKNLGRLLKRIFTGNVHLSCHTTSVLIHRGVFTKWTNKLSLQKSKTKDLGRRSAIGPSLSLAQRSGTRCQTSSATHRYRLTVSVVSLKHSCLQTRSSVHSALEFLLLMRYINLHLLTYLLTYPLKCGDQQQCYLQKKVRDLLELWYNARSFRCRSGRCHRSGRKETGDWLWLYKWQCWAGVSGRCWEHGDTSTDRRVATSSSSWRQCVWCSSRVDWREQRRMLQWGSRLQYQTAVFLHHVSNIEHVNNSQTVINATIISQNQFIEQKIPSPVQISCNKWRTCNENIVYPKTTNNLNNNNACLVTIFRTIHDMYILI